MFRYISLVSLLNDIDTNEKVLAFVMRHSLHENRNCSSCQAPMQRAKEQTLDGLVWRCYKKIVEMLLLRDGSFLEGSKMPLKAFILYLYFWCNDVPSQTIAGDLEIPEKAILKLGLKPIFYRPEFSV